MLTCNFWLLFKYSGAGKIIKRATMSSGIVVLNVHACYHGIGEDKCAIVWSDSSIFVGAHILWVCSSSAAMEMAGQIIT